MTSRQRMKIGCWLIWCPACCLCVPASKTLEQSRRLQSYNVMQTCSTVSNCPHKFTRLHHAGVCVGGLWLMVQIGSNRYSYHASSSPSSSSSPSPSSSSSSSSSSSNPSSSSTSSAPSSSISDDK